MNNEQEPTPEPTFWEDSGLTRNHAIGGLEELCGEVCNDREDGDDSSSTGLSGTRKEQQKPNAQIAAPYGISIENLAINITFANF